MNILKRSITSKLSLPAHPSRKLLSLLYSTTYTLNPPKPPKKSQTPTPSSSSSSKAEAVKCADWPRPSEITYQAKVANLVNLIGHIRAPVKFWISPDGKYWASTVINEDNSQERSCLIPIVFEGDLAHIATFHVKENDCVYVNGRLSNEPLPFLAGEFSLKLHLRVENINFVQGFEKQRRRKKFGGNASSEYDGTVMASKEEYKSDFSSNKGVSESIVSPVGTVMASKEEYKSDFSSKKDVSESIVSPVAEKDTTTTGSVGHKKGEDPVVDSWRDLVQNSAEWLDYREQKSNGLVSNRYPDFKRKDTGAALWLGSAPRWVLGGLGSLEFNVPPPRQKQVKDAKEELWRSLVENPNDWWDNRLNKKNPKAPDFKHKTRGEVLWLSNNTPEWVLSELPPAVREDQYL